MQRWTSPPFPLPVDPVAPFARVDLEFEGVEHDGRSFVALVYLNNRRVTEKTGRDQSKGFAAGFTVFAHGTCWGDLGHCDVPADGASPFDRRAEHRLTPQNITLDITEAVQGLGEVDELAVTVLAMDTSKQTGKDRDILRFSSLTLVTYE
jgi:hypothetical protein